MQLVCKIKLMVFNNAKIDYIYYVHNQRKDYHLRNYTNRYFI